MARQTVKIKPLSVNAVWQGRRFKTAVYKAYEAEMLYTLPELEISAHRLKISVWWGFSSKRSDIDNPTKPFLDILQKKYGFDDRDIYELNLKKIIVKKGEEFIKFDIEAI